MKYPTERLLHAKSEFAKAIFDAVESGRSPATILPMRRNDMHKGCVIRFSLGSR